MISSAEKQNIAQFEGKKTSIQPNEINLEWHETGNRMWSLKIIVNMRLQLVSLFHMYTFFFCSCISLSMRNGSRSHIWDAQWKCINNVFANESGLHQNDKIVEISVQIIEGKMAHKQSKSEWKFCHGLFNSNNNLSKDSLTLA